MELFLCDAADNLESHSAQSVVPALFRRDPNTVISYRDRGIQGSLLDDNTHPAGFSAHKRVLIRVLDQFIDNDGDVRDNTGFHKDIVTRDSQLNL